MDNRDAQYWSNNNSRNNNKTGFRNFDHFSHNVLGVVGAILTFEFIVPLVINGIRAIFSLWSNNDQEINDNTSRRDGGFRENRNHRK